MPADPQHPLRLATTASIQETGLLDQLMEAFQAASGRLVESMAVGTGQAIRAGRRGEADAVMVHNLEREIQFVESGHGVNRREFMTNDFVLLGPPGDPARAGRAHNIHEALEAVMKQGALFFSRADDSGTNLRELSIWAEATDLPFGRPWYRAAPGGMTACLEEASQAGGYTLADKGTFLARAKSLDLVVICDDPRHLRNPYSVIAVNPALHPDADYEGAMAWITFLTGQSGQSIVAAFSPGEHPLFHPIWRPGTPDPAGDGKARTKGRRAQGGLVR